jgi:hypothetical protein
MGVLDGTCSTAETCDAFRAKYPLHPIAVYYETVRFAIGYQLLASLFCQIVFSSSTITPSLGAACANFSSPARDGRFAERRSMDWMLLKRRNN